MVKKLGVNVFFSSVGFRNDALFKTNILNDFLNTCRLNSISCNILGIKKPFEQIKGPEFNFNITLLQLMQVLVFGSSCQKLFLLKLWPYLIQHHLQWLKTFFPEISGYKNFLHPLKLMH